jgi:hypothetical protein
MSLLLVAVLAVSGSWAAGGEDTPQEAGYANDWGRWLTAAKTAPIAVASIDRGNRPPPFGAALWPDGTYLRFERREEEHYIYSAGRVTVTAYDSFLVFLRANWQSLLDENSVWFIHTHYLVLHLCLDGQGMRRNWQYKNRNKHPVLEQVRRELLNLPLADPVELDAGDFMDALELVESKCGSAVNTPQS